MRGLLGVRFATAALLLVALAIALSGCGHSSSTTSEGSSAGKCPMGYVAGVVGGQSRCLQTGQQCEQQNASDYQKYGFSCWKKGKKYELKRTSSSGGSNSHG